MKTPEPPEGLSDGLYTAVESDGRVKFILTRRRKAIGQVTLPANEAGRVAANALGGAYDAFDQAAMGLVPASAERGKAGANSSLVSYQGGRSVARGFRRFFPDR